VLLGPRALRGGLPELPAPQRASRRGEYMPERISILLAVALADLLCTLDLVFRVWRTWVFFWNLAQRCSMLHLGFEVVNRGVHSGSEAGRFRSSRKLGWYCISI
jgi:hypothetical protein